MKIRKAAERAELDKIFDVFVEVTTRDYALQEKINVPAMAIIRNEEGADAPFTAFPILDPFTHEPKGRQYVANPQFLKQIDQLAKVKRTSVAMFMVAQEGVSGSKFGEKKSLLIAAKQDSGRFISRLYLRDLDGFDGILTESIGHDACKWVRARTPEGIEGKTGAFLTDSLWKGYLIVSQVEPVLEGYHSFRVLT